MTPKIMSKPTALVLVIILVLLSTLCVGSMEKINFQYSMKNVPIPSNKEFRLEFIQSVNIFMKNLKWRAWHYLNPIQNAQKKETFQFNSTSPPPNVPELKILEEKMQNLTKTLEFKEGIRDSFQQQLKKDLKNINTEERLVVPADKSSNFYKVSKNTYKTNMKKSIEKDYKKATYNIATRIDREDKKIAENLDIES